MRIVIDMQGAQNGSRHRGIGRYTLSLAKALIRSRGQHELVFALNARFSETLESLTGELRREYAEVEVVHWLGLDGSSFVGGTSSWRREVSELIRETFFASLEPDIVLVTSVVEGASDNTVTSIGQFLEVPTAAIFYDLIPLLYPEDYLADPRLARWYEEKLLYLRRASILFAISESSRNEAIQYLGIDAHRVFNIGAATDTGFTEIEYSGLQARALGERLPITKPFVLYTGAADSRKNLDRLIQSFASLPQALRTKHQLVIAGGLSEMNRRSLEHAVARSGLKISCDVIIAGKVSDDELIHLYNSCRLYVFPSLHEGFGLPALEAMACGAVVIGSNASSIPEVIGLDEALFDPASVSQITQKIILGLTDNAFRSRFTRHALSQVKNFSWDSTARRLIDVLEVKEFPRVHHHKDQLVDSLLAQIASLCRKSYREADLIDCAECIALIAS